MTDKYAIKRLKMLKKFVSKEEYRQCFRFVLIESGEKGVFAVASNGYILARVKLSNRPCKNSTASYKVDALIKHLQVFPETILVFGSDISISKEDCQWPNYEKLIPEDAYTTNPIGKISEEIADIKKMIKKKGKNVLYTIVDREALKVETVILKESVVSVAIKNREIVVYSNLGEIDKRETEVEGINLPVRFDPILLNPILELMGKNAISNHSEHTKFPIHLVKSPDYPEDFAIIAPLKIEA